MIIRSTRVVLPDGVRPAALHIENGVIAGIGALEPSYCAGRDLNIDDGEVDAGNLVVSPGIVDTHVHVNEPGRTEWEGFETATRAAAAGGVTTIVDMPLNSVPATTTAAALDAKRAAARDRCAVDVGFWGGVVPGNAGEIDALADAGVRGFKCFLAPSGVDEFPAVDEGELRRAMPVLARRRLPLLVHAELPARLAEPRDGSYAAYLASRPPDAEVDAIRLMAALARALDAQVHIVHVASAQAVGAVAAAKASGIRMSAETCPHYLTFAAGDIPAGATELKCAPPIRDASHRAALWDGLERGVLDLVASDHSPAPPAMKCRGDFRRAWGGIASLELASRAVWTGLAAREPRTDAALVQFARWMSEAPAKLAGLSTRKGRIAAGCDADLFIWDPDVESLVDAPRLQQRHKLTPYDGAVLRGTVGATFVRGRLVWDGTRAASRGGELV